MPATRSCRRRTKHYVPTRNAHLLRSKDWQASSPPSTSISESCYMPHQHGRADRIRPRDAHIRCCRRAESANVISTSQPSPRQYTWKTFCGAKPRNARDRKRRITREPSTSRATLGHPRTGQGPGEMDTGQINERERNGRNRAPYCSTRSYP